MAKIHYPTEQILEWIGTVRQPISSRQLISKFGMSRQTASRLLTELVQQNLLFKTGSTQTARYALPKKNQKPAPIPELKLKKKLTKLHEDEVFEEITTKLRLQKLLPENTYRIAYYAFCEMLNNAIDHSKGHEAAIMVRMSHGNFEFSIRDRGIGLFHNLQKGFELKSEEAAVEHLLKGKQTTAPQAHSGQGLFFTSKIADFLQLRSHRLLLTFDNIGNDLRLGESRPLIGTEVTFRIKSRSKKSLQALFEKYADDDFEFDRTEYPVIALAQNGAISRSQARRLTLGLDRFSKIILDFSKVKELGQAFADEIFRVFQNQNPKIVIETTNANSAVNFMIRRAQKS